MDIPSAAGVQKIANGISSWNYGRNFENCMRRVFGDKAYHIAGSSIIPRVRSSWIKKLIKHLLTLTHSLDVDDAHKQQIEFRLGNLLKSDFKKETVCWVIFFELFELLICFFGYEGSKGKKRYEILFWETKAGHYDVENKNGHFEKLQDQFFSATNKRGEIVDSLKNEGYNDFSISLILNTSEYQIKKIRKSRVGKKGE